MSLKFFADHCISSYVIQSLRDAGHEVLPLQDYRPADSPDAVVIAKAQQLDAILISLNSDFADIVTYPPAKYKGIIALQVRNHPEATHYLVEELITCLSTHDDEGHYPGKLFLVEIHRIRVRE